MDAKQKVKLFDNKKDKKNKWFEGIKKSEELNILLKVPIFYFLRNRSFIFGKVVLYSKIPSETSFLNRSSFSPSRSSIRKLSNEFFIAGFSMEIQLNNVKETFLTEVVCMKGENS